MAVYCFALTDRRRGEVNEARDVQDGTNVVGLSADTDIEFGFTWGRLEDVASPTETAEADFGPLGVDVSRPEGGTADSVLNRVPGSGASISFGPGFGAQLTRSEGQIQRPPSADQTRAFFRGLFEMMFGRRSGGN